MGMGAEIAIHTVNSGLVGLVALSAEEGAAAVLDVPSGGRVLVDTPDVVARVAELLGPSARATNPYEQRRRKEFIRRAGRSVVAFKAAASAASSVF